MLWRVLLVPFGRDLTETGAGGFSGDASKTDNRDGNGEFQKLVLILVLSNVFSALVISSAEKT